MPKNKSKKTKVSKKRNRYLQQEYTNIHNLDPNVPSVRSYNDQHSLLSSVIVDKFTACDIELTGGTLFNSSRGMGTTHNLDQSITSKSMEESDLKIEDSTYFISDDDTSVTQSLSQINSRDACVTAVNLEPCVFENGYITEIESSEGCYSETTVNDKILPLQEDRENRREVALLEEDLEDTKLESREISGINSKLVESLIPCDEPSSSTEDVEIPIEPLSPLSQAIAVALLENSHAECVSPSTSASLDSLVDVDNISVVSKDTDTTEEVLHYFGKPPTSHSRSTSCSSLSDSSCFKLDLDLDSTTIDRFEAAEINTSVSLGDNTCSTLEKRDPKSYLRQRSVKRARAKSMINPLDRNKPDGLKWPKKSSSGNLAAWLDAAAQSASCLSDEKLNQPETRLDGTEETKLKNTPRKSFQTSDLNTSIIAVEESKSSTKSRTVKTTDLNSPSTAAEETTTPKTSRKSSETSDLNSPSISVKVTATPKTSRKSSETSDLNFPTIAIEETTSPKTSRKSSETSDLNSPSISVKVTATPKTSRKSSETSDLNFPTIAIEETTSPKTSRKSSETSDLNSPSISVKVTATPKTSRKSSKTSDLNFPTIAIEETTSPKTSRKSSETSDLNSRSLAVAETTPQTSIKSCLHSDLSSPSNAAAAEEKEVYLTTQKHSKHSSVSNPDLGPISPNLPKTQKRSKSITLSGFPSTPTSSHDGFGTPRVLDLSDDQSTEAQGLAEDLAACRFETDSERGTASDMTDMVSCRLETDCEIGTASDVTEMLSCRLETDSVRGMTSEMTDTAACRFETDSEMGTLSEMSEITGSDGFATAVESRESLTSTIGQASLAPSYCSDIVPFYESQQFPKRLSSESIVVWYFAPIADILNFFSWIGLKMKSAVHEFFIWFTHNSPGCPCHQASSAAEIRLEVVEKELRKLQDLIIALSERPAASVTIIKAEENKNLCQKPPPPPPLPPPPPPMMAAAASLWKPIKSEKSQHNSLISQNSRMQITVEDLQRVALKKTPSMASNKTKKAQQNGPLVSLEMLRSVKLRSFQSRRVSQERIGSRVRKSSRSPRDRRQIGQRDPGSRGSSRTLLTIESDPIVEDGTDNGHDTVPLAKSLKS